MKRIKLLLFIGFVVVLCTAAYLLLTQDSCRSRMLQAHSQLVSDFGPDQRLQQETRFIENVKPPASIHDVSLTWYRFQVPGSQHDLKIANEFTNVVTIASGTITANRPGPLSEQLEFGQRSVLRAKNILPGCAAPDVDKLAMLYVDDWVAFQRKMSETSTLGPSQLDELSTEDMRAYIARLGVKAQWSPPKLSVIIEGSSAVGWLFARDIRPILYELYVLSPEYGVFVPFSLHDFSDEDRFKVSSLLVNTFALEDGYVEGDGDRKEDVR